MEIKTGTYNIYMSSHLQHECVMVYTMHVLIYNHDSIHEFAVYCIQDSNGDKNFHCQTMLVADRIKDSLFVNEGPLFKFCIV